jgi:hypothetical protein
MFRDDKEKHKAIKALKRKITTKRCYDAFFANDNGKIILYDMANECGFFRTSTTPDGNSVLSAFNDGKRAAFIYILNQLSVSDLDLLEMLKKIEQEGVL